MRIILAVLILSVLSGCTLFTRTDTKDKNLVTEGSQNGTVVTHVHRHGTDGDKPVDIWEDTTVEHEDSSKQKQVEHETVESKTDAKLEEAVGLLRTAVMGMAAPHTGIGGLGDVLGFLTSTPSGAVTDVGLTGLLAALGLGVHKRAHKKGREDAKKEFKNEPKVGGSP